MVKLFVFFCSVYFFFWVLESVHCKSMVIISLCQNYPFPSLMSWHCFFLVLSWLFCQLSLIPWFRRALSCGNGRKASWPCMAGWFWPPPCRTIWTISRCSFPHSLSLLEMRTSSPSLSLRFLHTSADAKGKTSHAEQPHTLYEQPGHIKGQGGSKTGTKDGADNGWLLQSLRSHVQPLPGPVLGIAKASAPGPFSSHALGHNRRFLWTLGNDVHPEPYPVPGIARVEAAAPFFSRTCGSSECQRQPVEHHGQEDHQDEPDPGFLQGWHLGTWAVSACHVGQSSGCDIPGCPVSMCLHVLAVWHHGLLSHRALWCHNLFSACPAGNEHQNGAGKELGRWIFKACPTAMPAGRHWAQQCLWAVPRLHPSCIQCCAPAGQLWYVSTENPPDSKVVTHAKRKAKNSCILTKNLNPSWAGSWTTDL